MINTEEINVIGKSESIINIMKTVDRIAGVDVNVLLLGKSGVGKTMLAKVIHTKSHRAGKPFVDLNCAAIPENLLESELFGYEKGAFTGASIKGKKGLIEIANGGTLLLDEISEMPLTLQAKLLKVVQEKNITRVGGVESIPVDFRLIAASNKDLKKSCQEGTFRKDLYYRLSVINITIPSLSERRSDISLLIDYLTEKTNQKYGLEKSFSLEAMQRMINYDWPGNVRELANIIERTVLMSEGQVIQLTDLPNELYDINCTVEVDSHEGLAEILENFERLIIKNAYKQYKTSVAVAKHLQISQPTAYRKIEKYVMGIAN